MVLSKSSHHAVQCVNHITIKLKTNKPKTKIKTKNCINARLHKAQIMIVLVILIQRSVTAATENLADCALLYSPALRGAAN